MESKKVSFKPAHFQTILLAAAIFVLMMASVEGILRLAAVQERLPPPGLRTNIHIFDEKIASLNAIQADEGHIDCLIIGSSTVLYGIHIAAFEEAYQAQTGQAITCFNLGQPTLTLSTVDALIDPLIDVYQPQLVVLGIVARDFIDWLEYDNTRPDWIFENNLGSTPWIEYLNGNFSFDGLLLDRTVSFRYYNTLEDWLAHGTTPYFQNIEPRMEAGYVPGLYFHPKLSPRLITLPPGQAAPEAYELSQADIYGLQNILDRDFGDTHILFVEMPTYNNLPDHQQRFQDPMRDMLQGTDVPLWMTMPSLEIPSQYWSDPLHLHIVGSILFSDWLGRQVGAAANQGLLTGTLPDDFVTQTPLDIPLNAALLAVLLERHGLSDENYQHFSDRVAAFDLVPADAILFNPGTRQDSQADLQVQLGLYNEWAVALNFGADPITDAEREQTYDLMVVLEKMRYEHELDLNEDQQAALQNWRQSKAPEDLRQVGLEYLVVTDEWLSWLSADESVTINNGHLLIASWQHPVETWQEEIGGTMYYLYQIIR
jgi:hypothetical protein